MAFGVEIYNASGNTVLSYTSRITRFSQNGSFIANGSSNTVINVSGMENNDSWGVFGVITSTPYASAGANISYIKNTGFFVARNTSGVAAAITYWVLRS
jgi:hypothetical protein